jgi:hypothetical protein
MGYQIEVDFEVIKALWAERKSEEESDNDVLRRILKMPPKNAGGASKSGGSGSDSKAWAWKGVSLPASTRLRMKYLSQTYEGEVRDGKWWINDRFFTTPSEAADNLARTRKGTRPSLDGWRYWYVKRPSDRDWIPLDDLRKGPGTGRPHRVAKPQLSPDDMMEGNF